ncbi:Excalibur domain protein, partial [Reticulomyxa filosa]
FTFSLKLKFTSHSCPANFGKKEKRWKIKERKKKMLRNPQQNVKVTYTFTQLKKSLGLYNIIISFLSLLFSLTYVITSVLCFRMECTRIFFLVNKFLTKKKCTNILNRQHKKIAAKKEPFKARVMDAEKRNGRWKNQKSRPLQQQHQPIEQLTQQQECQDQKQQETRQQGQKKRSRREAEEEIRQTAEAREPTEEKKSSEAVDAREIVPAPKRARVLFFKKKICCILCDQNNYK